VSAHLQHPLVIIALSYHGIIPAVWSDLQIIAVYPRLIGYGCLILSVDQVNSKKEQAQNVELFHPDLFSSLTG
jgi:hypothetical protein